MTETRPATLVFQKSNRRFSVNSGLIFQKKISYFRLFWIFSGYKFFIFFENRNPNRTENQITFQNRTELNRTQNRNRTSTTSGEICSSPMVLHFSPHVFWVEISTSRDRLENQIYRLRLTGLFFMSGGVLSGSHWGFAAEKASCLVLLGVLLL